MPVSPESLVETYAEYVSRNPAEMAELTPFNNQLVYAPGEAADPKTLPAHATASAVLFDPDGRVLLTRIDSRWAFPGGHTDPQDPDLLRTACRHLAEATRLPQSMFSLYAPHNAALDFKDDELVQPDGGKHLHHDFLFAFRLAPGRALSGVRSIEARVDDFRWVGVETFKASARLYAKLRRVVPE
jgi:8-oxo-dGTP pyrophosphatase MutT (NUDIX family)